MYIDMCHGMYVCDTKDLRVDLEFGRALAQVTEMVLVLVLGFTRPYALRMWVASRTRNGHVALRVIQKKKEFQLIVGV